MSSSKHYPSHCQSGEGNPFNYEELNIIGTGKFIPLWLNKTQIDYRSVTASNIKNIFNILKKCTYKERMKKHPKKFTHIE